MGQKQLQRWHLMKMVEVGKITLKEREEKMNVSYRKLAGNFRVGLLSDLISSPGIKSKRYLKAQTEAPQSHQRPRIAEVAKLKRRQLERRRFYAVAGYALLCEVPRYPIFII